jgi:Na+/phosphate symporter
VKTTPKGRVQVIQEGNDKVNTRDNINQIDELIDAYRVILSNDLEENLNFYVAENIFVDIDVEELNDIIRTNGHKKVDEGDNIDEHQFNEEDYDGHDDDEIKEKEEKEEKDNLIKL